MTCAIGIDIGGTHLRAARVNGGVIQARASDHSSADPRIVLARVLSLIAKVRNADVKAIGIGAPGEVNPKTRRVLSGGFVDLSVFDFAAEVEAATTLPVVIENDATMALLGEVAHGTAQGLQNVVLLTIGTGIGGAVLEQGKVIRGRASAGQLGHLCIDPNGRNCVCGRIGCVETVSSGSAFATHLAEAGLASDIRVEDLLARKDDIALGVINSWARPLRAAIDTLISIFNPDCVLIGGGAGQAAISALAIVHERPSWFSAPILGAKLGDDAGVIGAANAAIAARPRKRAVLINGVPASGKSTIARTLADATGWPILTLDTIKNPFLTHLPPSDTNFNLTLGKASFAAIFDLISDAPDGTTFIIDAWIGFQPLERLSAGIAHAGLTDLAEVWCHAPAETVSARYRERTHLRPAGHPGIEYLPELTDLAMRAKPTGLPFAAGPFDVETTGPLDLRALIRWLGAIWH